MPHLIRIHKIPVKFRSHFIATSSLSVKQVSEPKSLEITRFSCCLPLLFGFCRAFTGILKTLFSSAETKQGELGLRLKDEDNFEPHRSLDCVPQTWLATGFDPLVVTD